MRSHRSSWKGALCVGWLSQEVGQWIYLRFYEEIHSTSHAILHPNCNRFAACGFVGPLQRNLGSHFRILFLKLNSPSTTRLSAMPNDFVSPPAPDPRTMPPYRLNNVEKPRKCNRSVPRKTWANAISHRHDRKSSPRKVKIDAQTRIPSCLTHAGRCVVIRPAP
jgi:hypothetical protein